MLDFPSRQRQPWASVRTSCHVHVHIGLRKALVRKRDWCCLLTGGYPTWQERDAAKGLFASEEAQATHASKTFEPDEDLAAAQQQAGVATAMEICEKQHQPDGEGQGQADGEAAPALATAVPTQEHVNCALVEAIRDNGTQQLVANNM